MNNSALASMEGYALCLAGCIIFLQNNCCRALLEPVLQNSTRQCYSVDFFLLSSLFLCSISSLFVTGIVIFVKCAIVSLFSGVLFRNCHFYIDPCYMNPLLGLRPKKYA